LSRAERLRPYPWLGGVSPARSLGYSPVPQAVFIGTRKYVLCVATVTKISATSPEGFEAAIKEGIERANKTLRDVQGTWVKDMSVLIEDGSVKGYSVNLEVTFVLDDT
jgi:flavin-binding protein dodecin